MISIRNVSMHYELGDSSVRVDRLSADELADLRRDHIGIVFQSFHLVPSLSALENVALLRYRIQLDVENTWWAAIAVAVTVSGTSLGFGARYLLRRLRVSPAILLRSGG
jgi:predicted ABC-type transport system involved in lysophospholipase L1 biosynthesis ATPase subunit